MSQSQTVLENHSYDTDSLQRLTAHSALAQNSCNNQQINVIALKFHTWYRF